MHAELVVAALKRLHGDATNPTAVITAMKTTPIAAPRGPVTLNTTVDAPTQNIYVCKVENVNGTLEDVPIKTYPNVLPWGTLPYKVWQAEYATDSTGAPGRVTGSPASARPGCHPARPGERAGQGAATAGQGGGRADEGQDAMVTGPLITGRARHTELVIIRRSQARCVGQHGRMKRVHYDDSGGQRGMIAGNWLLRGMIAARRSADMGGPNPGRRTRALGTRDRVLSYLADGEISDPKGMASTVLAEAVGYPGSSAAFAQLLSGMERSGLIEREIRGKRTYRIAATAAGRGGGHAPGPRPWRAGRARGHPRAGRTPPGPPRGRPDAPGPGVAGRTPPGRGAAGRTAAWPRRRARRPAGPGRRRRPPRRSRGGEPGPRLRLRRAGPAAAGPGGAAARGLARDSPPPEHGPAGPRTSPARARPARSGQHRDRMPRLQQTVAGLEQKLASVRSRQRRLTAENAKLREQLQAAQQSLAQAEERASAARITGQLGGPELQLLERLLSASRDQPGRQEEAGAG